MDMNRMTIKLQEGLQRASALASQRNHQGIDAEHLLLALLEQENGVAASLVEAAGVSPRALRDAADRELARRPQVKGPATGPAQAFITQRLAQLLDRAERERTTLKDDYLSVEHVLLAIVDENAPLIRDLGLTREKLR